MPAFWPASCICANTRIAASSWQLLNVGGPALRWFRKAGESGNAEAQFNADLSYANGHGVRQNMGTAAAAALSPFAQLNLGLCYVHGVGVPKGTAAAAELLRKAAAQGSETAQRALNAHFPGRGKSGGGFQPLTRALSPEAHAGALEMNPGTRVRLAGLQSEAGKARNGQAGRCGGKCDSGSGRFHVALDDGFCGKFRPENLEVNI